MAQTNSNTWLLFRQNDKSVDTLANNHILGELTSQWDKTDFPIEFLNCSLLKAIEQYQGKSRSQ